MTQKSLKVTENNIGESINEFLKNLLSSKKIHALLVEQATPSNKVTFPTFISDPKKLQANVLAPVLSVSTAQIVSKMTKMQAASKPIGVVIRPCQIRALIELQKLNQAKLDNLLIIGVDCLGTFPLNTYSDFPEKKQPTEVIIDAWMKKTDDAQKYYRSACQVCKDLVPSNADITIGLFGADLQNEVIIEANTPKGKEALEGITLDEGGDSKKREKVIKEIHEQNAKKHAEFCKEKSTIKGIEKLAEFFDKCVNCHNCRQACPICYCKECLYDSSVFDAEAYKFIRKAEVKGLFKMPNDSLLFHLGRMNHMILSCVQCGLCEQACPNMIPLMDIFIPAAENAQKEFEYHPGKDSKEKIPMIVYREDEFTEVGEK
jgi:formate dehydrogenase subunit beta